MGALVEAYSSIGLVAAYVEGNVVLCLPHLAETSKGIVLDALEAVLSICLL